MARARNIKPAFFKNEHLAMLSPHARLLFIGLWCLADVKGRLEDRPARIKAELFPYESIDVDAMLNELVSSPGGFIVRYEVEGNRYLEVVHFRDHQSPHPNEKKTGSKIPPKTEKVATSNILVSYQSPTAPAESLLLIPESLLSDPPLPTDEKMPDERGTQAHHQSGFWAKAEGMLTGKGMTQEEAKRTIDQLTKAHGIMNVSEAFSKALHKGPDRPLAYVQAILKNQSPAMAKTDPWAAHDELLSPWDCAEQNGCLHCLQRVKEIESSQNAIMEGIA